MLQVREAESAYRDSVNIAEVSNRILRVPIHGLTCLRYRVYRVERPRTIRTRDVYTYIN